jgi:hypothetical protein
MSFRDFLQLAVAAAFIALAAVLHSPFAESLSGIRTSVNVLTRRSNFSFPRQAAF